MMNNNKLCSVSDCGRKVHCQGWCDSHYQRWRKGDLNFSRPIEKRVKQMPICSVEGCNNPTRAKNYCNAHYTRLRTKGSVRADKPIKPICYSYADICLVDGCDLPKRKLGRCEKHYLRFRTTDSDFRPDHCDICGEKCVPCWDHSHRNKKFRGWLCGRCNRVLGSVNDDVSILTKMIKYLEKK